MSKINEQKACKNFRCGYNCAQSVLLAYADEMGLDREFALKLSSSFGGGMGRLREVCGAVSAMFMIAGMKYGYTKNNDDTKKAHHYALIQNLAEEFKQKHETIICRELLGYTDEKSSPIPEERTEEYYEKRPCENFIATACQILDSVMVKSGEC